MRTSLSLEAVLPLTCTRSGTCCHGKAVWVNPWELARLAATMQVSPRVFAHRFTEVGTRLLSSGPAGYRGLPACVLYDGSVGCRAHPGRPLVCRLYPLGRVVDASGVSFVHDGPHLPCLESCPDVDILPHMTVKTYLEGQQVEPGIAAQEAYRELVADLAEAAFAVLIDSGLLAHDPAFAIQEWEQAAGESAMTRAGALGPWWEALMLPTIVHTDLDKPRVDVPVDDPLAWVFQHREQLFSQLNAQVATLTDHSAVAQASGLCLRLALHLAQACGSDPRALAGTWIQRAKTLPVST